MAISADAGADPVAAAEMGMRIAKAMIDAPRPNESEEGYAPLLNVNIPSGHAWPVLTTTLGTRLYGEYIEFRSDPRGREYLWIGGGQVKHPEMAGSDTAAYDEGAVSITPLLLDLTAHGRASWAQGIASSLRGPITEEA